MMCWKVVMAYVFYHSVWTCATQRRSKVLFPSAHRVKRGLASMVNPILQNSIEDVNLLFEILLVGLQIEGERSSCSVRDEELASLWQTRKLEVICRDVLPQRLSDVRRLVAELSRHPGGLHREDFERTVMTMVYTAYRLAHATGHQKNAWAESFASLYRAIKHDLTM